MIRRLFRLILGGGFAMPIVDDLGTSYREQLLKGLLHVHELLDRRPDPESLKIFQGLLKDLHDFEYAADRSEVGELRKGLERLEERQRLLEGLMGTRRIEPAVTRGRIT